LSVSTSPINCVTIALHVAKVAGAAASVARGESPEGDFVSRRVPNMLLFGLKLSTVNSEKLPDVAIVEAGEHRIRAVA